MEIVKNRLHKLKSKKFTFDNLSVVTLAVLSLWLTGQTMVFGNVGEYIEATDNTEVTEEVTTGRQGQEDSEIPILVDSKEEGLEGSILTIKSSGVSAEDTSNEHESEKQELESEPETEEVGKETEEVKNTTYNLNLEGLSEYKVNFIHTIVPDAMEVAREYNVYPSIIVAQSILESDWGRSPLAVNANNLFGIKGTYNGSFVWHETKEDDGTGFQYTVTDKFAKYPSYRESIESNAKLVRQGLTYDKNFYSGAWVENTSNYQEATLFLTGTYATDINYNQKVNGVIQEHNLQELDSYVFNK